MNVGKGTHARDAQDRQHHLGDRKQTHTGARNQEERFGELGVPTVNADPIQWVFHQTREQPWKT